MKTILIPIFLILCLEYSLIYGRGIRPRIMKGKGAGFTRWVENFEPFPGTPAHETPTDEYFDQKLDHSDQSDETMWKQRFFRRETYYQDALSRNMTNMPVFVKIGGESAANPVALLSSYWLVPARKYGALLFNLEHRYYGKSKPTKDLTHDNLKYLTSEQALEDLANFIQSMRKEYKLTDENKVICFGGSYSASLAAWMRMKHPEICDGSVASSAPVLAQVDFPEYFDIVMQSMKTVGGEECTDTVKEAISQITEMSKTQEGCDKLYDLLTLCGDLEPDNKLDIQTLFNSLAQGMADVVQSNVPNPRPGDFQINDMCKMLTDESESDPLKRFVTLNKKLNSDCTECNYKYSIKDLRSTSYDSYSGKEGTRQWRWQTCNEFGYFQTSKENDSLVGPNVQYTLYTQTCRDAFYKGLTDDVVDKNIDYTNSIYKGKTKVPKVCYVQGTLDPWKALGLDEEQGAIVIEGVSHCGDMHTPHDGDPQSLIEGRKEIDKCLDDILTEN